MSKVPEMFGELLFDDRKMKARLSSKVYTSLKETIDRGTPLDASIANEVASAMRDWAVEKGATHFTHWFQPMTGITAEKHDSFITPSPDGGVLMEFSGKELIKGEPDASSFPSGGIRATFEARGYTAWDPSSPAFIKDRTLCIPTAFCSYNGEALDKKTPLLRSMEVLSREAVRVLHAMGAMDVQRVSTNVGPEQEYFLVDRAMYEQRRDLMYTGRTLFGAKSPKGQEMEDHYFGVIKPRVSAYMADLNEELWKLGILAKTEHNEVAPAQHELACIYTTTNIATDDNQLVMEIMKRTALKHGLVCLLHEKPFAGVNGSGKHNNWSIATDTGINLLSPGDTPDQNVNFLLFLTATIKAVDDYQDLLRTAVASAGNDHRLGANEAPPAVISIFLGEELTAVLDAIEKGVPYTSAEKQFMKLGVDLLPKFAKDSTDRNRTSPFAFTGNKFEFRMVGSSDSIACTNTMLNSATAAILKEFADRLEKSSDPASEAHAIIIETIKAHKHILFNGNGYDDAWIEEAVTKRGLTNLPTTADCIPVLTKEKNMKMLTSLGIYTETELESRAEIVAEGYNKILFIEASTMIDMARKQIIPAVEKYESSLCAAVLSKEAIFGKTEKSAEKDAILKLDADLAGMYAETDALEAKMDEISKVEDEATKALKIKDELLPIMVQLRVLADDAETRTASEMWPFPTYGDLLFGVR